MNNGKIYGRIIRVPEEFHTFVNDLKNQAEKETGEKYSNMQIMRKMGNKLKGKLIIRGHDFDWKLF